MYVNMLWELWTAVIQGLRLSRYLAFLSPRACRYVKQRREQGHVRPKTIPGRPSKKRAQVEASVLPQLQMHDDARLSQHCAMWEQAHGKRVRSFPMSRAIKRLGWTRSKKSLGATERNEEERAAWRENANQLPTESLVFIDECGSNIALTPMYARAPKGERARGKVPRNRGKNTTLIAALSLEGMGAALILEGSANTTASAAVCRTGPGSQPPRRADRGHGQSPGAQKCTGQAGDRSERLSAPLLAWLPARPLPRSRT